MRALGSTGIIDEPASSGELAKASLTGEAVGSPDLLSTSEAGLAAARGGALRVGGYVAGALVGVISAALMSRHLGVVDYGEYVTALSLVAIVGAASDLGLTAVGVREISRRTGPERWSIARDLLGLRLTLTVVGCAAVIAIAWAAYSATLGAGVALASVGLLLQATQDNFALPLVVGLRLGWVSALELARQLLATSLTVVLVLAGATLLGFLAIPIPVGLVILIATAFLVRGTRSLVPSFSVRRWWGFLRVMLPYAAAIAASVLYFRVSILLVSALSSSVQLGYFSLSFRVIEVLTLVPGLLASSAFPIFARAARDDHKRLGYALGRVHEVATIVGAFVAVEIAVGAPLAIAIVGGPKFAPAASVLAVQGVALGAMFVSAVWANGLLSLGLYRQILAINVSLLALNAVLVSVLVTVNGAHGAATGTAIAEIVAAIVQAAAVARGRAQLRPPMRVLPRTALAAGAGLIPLAFTGVPTIVRLVASAALFAAVVIATRVLPPELGDVVPAIGWLVPRPGGR